MTIGIQHSASVAHQVSLSPKISMETEAHLFSMFSAELSVSPRTGYNWTKPNTLVKSLETRREVRMI